MNAHKTRVCKAFPGGEGLADSHIDLIAPVLAGRFHSVTRRTIRTSNSDNASSAGEAQPTAGRLSDAQLATFWDGILANLDAARRVARKIVSRQDVDDVVHTAAVRFVESLQGPKPSTFPATDGQFQALFLDIARRYGIDCVRNNKHPALPIRSHWGVAWEPVVRGHNVADRPLDSVFVRNDEGDYDAPAAAARREQDDIDELRRILEVHLDGLSQAQREILVESFFNEGKRADIAARRGITVSTYDNHRQAAFKALRESLAADVEASTGIDRSIWYDRIEELIERRASRLRGRSSSKKGKRPPYEGKHGTSEGESGTSEGKGGTAEGKSGNSQRKSGTPAGKRGNLEAEHRAVKGERPDSAPDRGNNGRAGGAGKPLTGTSPAARNEPELAGSSS
jgi:RNA polymerase sigma factor (sigma-70 family)